VLGTVLAEQINCGTLSRQAVDTEDSLQAVDVDTDSRSLTPSHHSREGRVHSHYISRPYLSAPHGFLPYPWTLLETSFFSAPYRQVQKVIKLGYTPRINVGVYDLCAFILITHTKFCDNRFKGFGVLIPSIFPFY